ncbi:MAG: tRNA-dihydrouridine synthase family protein [Bdellovibrionaceae bacterium]|jgi:tRNA-dihydrouridine synthase C|nr:tRNA-dihydrouridine synthase family protein [Pseudobdellovibrionaceae bacterium]
MAKKIQPDKIFLAPMEGVFDPALREVYSKIGGYDSMTTEFIRVTQNILPPKVFYKYSPELKQQGQTKHGTPVYIQLLGGDANLLAENAQQAVELGAPGIDLNFGCPAKTVNRHDGGSILLKSPDRLFNIVSQVRKSIPKEIPVSAKVRLGFENKDLHLEIARAVSEAQASWLTIHARTKMEAYKKPAHWVYIAKMQEVIDIPVIANGDINSMEDYLKCYEITGCKNIAVGRGAFARPDLANILKGELEYNGEQVMELLKEMAVLYERGGLQNKITPRTKQWSRFLGPNYPLIHKFFEKYKTQHDVQNPI